MNELDQNNLKILAEGKYQNWKKDIEKLGSEEAIIQYKNSFFHSLNELKLNKNKTTAISQKNKNSKIFFIAGGCIWGGLVLMIWHWYRRRNT